MKSLVVIDDEKIVVDGIGSALEYIRNDIVLEAYALDGVSAFDLLRLTSPDIVITDIRIPGMDGLSLIEAAKIFLPNTAFIIISGYQEFEYARKALSLGVVDYIDKPVTIPRLAAALEKAVSLLEKEGKHHVEPVCNIDRVVDRFVHYLHNGRKEELQKHIRETFFEIKANSSFQVYKKEVYKVLCVLTMIAFDEDAGLRVAVKRLPSYKEFDKMENYEAVEAYINETFFVMVNQFKNFPEDESSQVISRLLQYINENYDQEIGLAELANMAHMNMTYLSVLFKQKVGMSYIKYITNLRIEKAKLLLSQNYKVIDICGIVGYNNYRHFCELFKRATGKTPSEYRQEIGKG